MKISTENPIIFFSYATFDNEHDRGFVDWLRLRLQGEARIQSGKLVELFLDRTDIRWGQRWELVLHERLQGSMFLLILLTPNYFKSQYCRMEYEAFRKREGLLGRNDLILPIYYITSDSLEGITKGQPDLDDWVKDIADRQYRDWRKLRGISKESDVWFTEIQQLAQQVVLRLTEQKQADNSSVYEMTIGLGPQAADKIEQTYLMCPKTQAHIVQVLYKSVHGEMVLDDLYQYMRNCYEPDLIQSETELYYRAKDLANMGLVELEQISDKITMVRAIPAVAMVLMKRGLLKT